MHSHSTALKQPICTTFGNQIALQTIRTISSNCVAEQWVSLSGCCNRIAEQWIGLSSAGNSIECEQRESEAEDGLAFHVDVLRVQWLGMEPILRRLFDMRT
ncbi:hypothetical protein PS898_04880 [Pseudomonas fluorescens]|nr:hypothetical protein PS898_04880 [Pseudomonas fluorescens]